MTRQGDDEVILLFLVSLLNDSVFLKEMFSFSDFYLHDMASGHIGLVWTHGRKE